MCVCRCAWAYVYVYMCAYVCVCMCVCVLGGRRRSPLCSSPLVCVCVCVLHTYRPCFVCFPLFFIEGCATDVLISQLSATEECELIPMCVRRSLMREREVR